MLQFIRNRAGSWIVQILFVFLILSFGIWGIGDVFRGQGPDQTVAEVGDVKISAIELDRAFQVDVDRMRQQLGAELDTQTAISLGFLNLSLQRLINDALLAQMAADAGLGAPDAMLAERIREQPLFQDGGRFNRDLFLQFLSSQRLSEAGYVDQLRRDLSRSQLLGAVAAGAAIPDGMAEMLWRVRGQTRTATTITFAAADVGELPEPSADQLAAYHTLHADRFTAPEYRAVTIVSVTPEEMTAEISIPEEEVLDEYEARRASYEQPERRTFTQAIAADEATAAAIADKVAAGGAIADAAAESGATVNTLGPVSRQEMFPDALAEAGFALAEGGAGRPVQTPFGWHVLVLDAVEPAGTTPLEEVRGEIEQELKLERARDAVFEVTNGLEDALAGGSSLEEAAASLALTIVATPALARDGTPRGDAAVPDSPVLADAIAVAFGLPAGAESGLEETEQGEAFVVRVDEIVAAAVIPFEEARAEVAAAWAAERRLALAKEKAEAAALRLRGPAVAAAIAAELGGTAGTTPALLRDGSNAEGTPRDLITSLFSAAEGEVITVATADGAIAARLDTVAAPDPATRADGIAAVRDAEDGGIRQDLLAQFAQALTERYRVEIDSAAIERYYTPG